jgi:YVTN family beta-propeller protein
MSLHFSFRTHAIALTLAGLLTNSVAVAAEPSLAYVSNQEGGVTIIDLATFEPVREIDVGNGAPRGIGVTADGALLVTANRDTGDLALIDRVRERVVARIPIGKNPEFVRVRGDYAFVSFEPAATGGPPPAPGSAEARALEQKRDEGASERARVAVVDLRTQRVVREIVAGLETEGIEFAADGKRIVVTNEADETLTVHDIATGELLRTIETRAFGNRPRGIKLTPDGRSYVATLEFGNALLLLDGEFNPVRSIPTGDVPYGLAFDRSGERLFVALTRGKALQVFDARTYEMIKEVPTGERCWHFSFTPDDAHILVACGRSHEVVVIDATTLEPIKRIADGKMPWGIVTYPKAPGSLDQP